MQVRIRLNGTKVNPYGKMGLERNPFPAIPNADPMYREANRILGDLEARPIINVADLRERLAGCTKEFIELCVSQFRKGKTVQFDVTFPDPVS